MENKGIDFMELPVDPDLTEHPEGQTVGPITSKYLETVLQTENFVAERLHPSSSEIRPYGWKYFSDPNFVRLARFAVEEFNSLKGAKFGFVRIARVTGMTWMTAYGTNKVCYFTLECDDGKFYEAKVCDFDFGRSVLYIFRPAKNYPWIRESGYSDDKDWDSEEEFESDPESGDEDMCVEEEDENSKSGNSDVSKTGVSCDGSKNGVSCDGSKSGNSDCGKSGDSDIGKSVNSDDRKSGVFSYGSKNGVSDGGKSRIPKGSKSENSS